MLADGLTSFVDEERIAAEARLDRTWDEHTDRPTTRDVALVYKHFRTVERVLRSIKSLLPTRTVWHKCDEAISTHAGCTHIASVSRTTMKDRLEAAQIDKALAHDLAAFDRLLWVEVGIKDQCFRMRGSTSGCAGRVLQAVGVAASPSVCLIPCEQSLS